MVQGPGVLSQGGLVYCHREAWCTVTGRPGVMVHGGLV